MEENASNIPTANCDGLRDTLATRSDQVMGLAERFKNAYRGFRSTNENVRLTVEETGSRLISTPMFADRLKGADDIFSLLNSGKILEAAHRTIALTQMFWTVVDEHGWKIVVIAYNNLVMWFEYNTLGLICGQDKLLLELILNGKYQNQLRIMQSRKKHNGKMENTETEADPAQQTNGEKEEEEEEPNVVRITTVKGEQGNPDIYEEYPLLSQEELDAVHGSAVLLAGNTRKILAYVRSKDVHADPIVVVGGLVNKPEEEPESITWGSK